MDSFPLNAHDRSTNICTVNFVYLHFSHSSSFFNCAILRYFFAAKSPYKLSTTEKRVIGGLKNLTELLFKDHFKQTGDGQSDDNEPIKSDEMAMNVEYSTSSDEHAFANKENADGNVQQFEEKKAESFCAMVVSQLTSGDDPISNDHKNEEWHHGQLKAYNWAHDQLFEKK